MNLSLIPPDPVMPFAVYKGGKKNLARRIVGRIASIDHRTYVEPFVGLGGVFLRRPFRARAEVVNDVARDVATRFRVLQRHYGSVPGDTVLAALARYFFKKSDHNVLNILE